MEQALILSGLSVPDGRSALRHSAAAFGRERTAPGPSRHFDFAIGSGSVGSIPYLDGDSALAEALRKPRRMNPADRKVAILQCAATIVANEGVSAVTMDRIAQESGVSRSLIYVYFSNVTILLQELYLLETNALRKRQREESAKVEGFEDYVRCLTRLYLEHTHERGDFMTKLMHERSVTDVLQSNFSKARRISGRAIAERIAKQHAIPVSLAEKIADIGMGITARAGEQIQRFGLPLAEATDLAVTMILGAIEASANAYHRGELTMEAFQDVDIA